MEHVHLSLVCGVYILAVSRRLDFDFVALRIRLDDAEIGVDFVVTFGTPCDIAAK